MRGLPTTSLEQVAAEEKKCNPSGVLETALRTTTRCSWYQLACWSDEATLKKMRLSLFKPVHVVDVLKTSSLRSKDGGVPYCVAARRLLIYFEQGADYGTTRISSSRE
eukprot:scpid74136/ scgid15812/ 